MLVHDISHAALLSNAGSVIGLPLDSYRFFAPSPLLRHVILSLLVFFRTPTRRPHAYLVHVLEDVSQAVFGQSLDNLGFPSSNLGKACHRSSFQQTRVIQVFLDLQSHVYPSSDDARFCLHTQSQRSRCTTVPNHFNSKRGPHLESHHILR